MKPSAYSAIKPGNSFFNVSAITHLNFDPGNPYATFELL